MTAAQRIAEAALTRLLKRSGPASLRREIAARLQYLMMA